MNIPIVLWGGLLEGELCVLQGSGDLFDLKMLGVRRHKSVFLSPGGK